MKKHKKKLLIISVPLILVVSMLGIALWVFFTTDLDDNDSSDLPPAQYIKTTNTTTTWKTFSSKQMDFSYPPGWVLEQCIKQCADDPGIKLSNPKTGAYLGTYQFGPAEDCTTKRVQLWRVWVESSLPYLNTKDGKRVDVIEGTQHEDSSDVKSKLVHRLYATLSGDKSFCTEITGSDGSEKGIVKQIIETLILH